MMLWSVSKEDSSELWSLNQIGGPLNPCVDSVTLYSPEFSSCLSHLDWMRKGIMEAADSQRRGWDRGVGMAKFPLKLEQGTKTGE